MAAWITVRPEARRSDPAFGDVLRWFGEDGEHALAAGLMAVDRDVGEAGGAASLGEQVGLFDGPAVAGEAGCSWFDLTLDREEAARGTQHSTDFGEAGVEVVPMVHGRERPRDGCGTIGQRQRFGGAVLVADRRCGAPAGSGQGAGDAEHHRCRVDADD